MSKFYGILSAGFLFLKKILDIIYDSSAKSAFR